MQWISGTKNWTLPEGASAVTLGKFEGIHRGHQKLLALLRDEKRRHGLVPVVFTFSMPENIPGRGALPSILTEKERAERFAGFGMDYVYEFPFDEQTRTMSPETFLDDVLIGELKARVIAVGDDFRFGKDRAGDAAFLVREGGKRGLTVYAVPKERDRRGEVISSTLVRELLTGGKIEEANGLLGYWFPVTGPVVHGLQLARTLDFPTINQIPESRKLLPPYGVYASIVTVEGRRFAGLTNIGCKPTVSDQKTPWAETYLFGFDGDLYGKMAQTELLRFIRPERKFASVEELKGQLAQDAEQVSGWFRTHLPEFFGR